jgi:mannose-1-phosphate guanylyltransferase
MLVSLPTIVLTAGLGTRLEPITRVVAKPAVPMAGKTLIERVLGWLRDQGIDDVVLNLHHKPETITAIVGDGAELGLRVRYSWEREILGSAGGPKLALTLWPDLSGPCLIVNGDTLTDLALEPLIDAHRASGARVTMAVIANPRPDNYNGIRADANNAVTGFIPKGHTEPTWHFVGIQVVDPHVFDRLPPGQPAETVSGLYRELIVEAPGSVRVFPVSVPFLDVGTPADYLDAVIRLAGRDVVIEGTADVDPSAELSRCVIWDQVTIGPGVRLSNCVVLSGAQVKASARAPHQVLFINP